MVNHCNKAGAPSVMHRVTSSLSWILENLEAEGSGLCPREAEPSPHCVTVAGFSFLPEKAQSKLRWKLVWNTLILSGAVVGMPCIFPSIVAGVNITTCTRIDGDEVQNTRDWLMQCWTLFIPLFWFQKPWCSTKVDNSGVQEVGHWGYCPLTGC